MCDKGVFNSPLIDRKTRQKRTADSDNTRLFLRLVWGAQLIKEGLKKWLFVMTFAIEGRVTLLNRMTFRKNSKRRSTPPSFLEYYIEGKKAFIIWTINFWIENDPTPFRTFLKIHPIC